MLSNRINKIEASGIRKIFALAAGNKGEYVNLSIGQPHYPASDNLKAAAKKAIDDNRNAYTPTAGIPELKEKIVAKLNADGGKMANADEVIVTAGVSGALYLLFSSIFDEGDEVILPDPYFVMYKEMLIFLGAKPVYLDTYPDFHIKADKLAALVTPRTKAVIINSPGNPTGAVHGREELEKIADVARKNDLLLISDEIYEVFDYSGRFVSLRSLYGKTVTLNGFSKSHSITGWRVGYAQGPVEIIEAMNKLQQYTFVCAPSFAQVAVADEFSPDLSEEVAMYKKNSELVYEGLHDKYELNKPEGAFYAFIKTPNGNATEFVDKCVENKLLVVPGGVFSQRNDYFRLSFATDQDNLEKGIEILRRMV